MSAQVDVLEVMDRDAAHADAYRIVYGVFDSTPQHLASESQKARAAVAALIAERDALREEVERLRRDCAEAYQVVGAGMLGEPCSYTQADVGRALDNLSAAASGEPRLHDDLLPWPSALVVRRPDSQGVQS